MNPQLIPIFVFAGLFAALAGIIIYCKYHKIFLLQVLPRDKNYFDVPQVRKVKVQPTD